MNTIGKYKLKSLAVMLALPSTIVQAQNSDSEIVEEVLVTGIRASLERAMDTKRYSSGVVEAIAAEDIGKFPDTNLADSMQRIPGVSISRRDGEGASITVRGFGPQFNSVTLNGRQIPNANASRGFNFDTVAAELVNGVDVIKTGSAAVISGGVGSSVNVKTARPFDINDRIAGQVKGITDSSNNEYSPALSGLISRNFDDVFGVLASVSYQERKFERDSIEVRRWRASELITEDANGDDLTLSYFPTQTAVTFKEIERKRTNANLALQYAVNESATATLDINYSDLKTKGYEIESASWRTYSTADGEYWATDANGVATFHQFRGRGMDFFIGAPESREISQQIGVNYDWNINDQSYLIFDLAHSSSESNPDQELSINRSDVQAVDLDYTFLVDGDKAYHTYDSDAISLTSAKLHQQDVYSNNNLDELDQVRIDYGFDGDNVAIKAGLMYTDQTKTLTGYNNNRGENADAYSFRGKYDLVGDTDALFSSVEAAEAAGYGVHTMDHKFAGEMTYIGFDPEAAYSWLDLLRTDSSFGGLNLVKQTDWSEINEKTLSAYMEAEITAEINGQPLVMVAGVRTETTSVDSTSLEEKLVRLEYVQDGEEYDKIYGDSIDYTDGKSYDVVLPNMSVKYNFTDEIIGRIAASKTITRPELSNMKSSRTYSSYRHGGDIGDASAGNPSLKPFMSNNLDISAEWYFDDVSYLSLGYFKKVVDNFIGIIAEKEDIEGVYITDEIVDPDHNFNSDPIQATYNIVRPRNAKTKVISGIEGAVQYTFGDSGFGVIANYTYTDTDSPFTIDQTDESAVLGLSDSANLIAFFDKYGYQVRLAYNWRDSFVEKWGHTYSAPGEPTQVDEYSQVDLSASYDITDEITLFMEGINITSEDLRKTSRYDNQMLWMIEGSARYALGVRAKF